MVPLTYGENGFSQGCSPWPNHTICELYFCKVCALATPWVEAAHNTFRTAVAIRKVYINGAMRSKSSSPSMVASKSVM